MQRTKLGISVGLFGAAVYFMGLCSGYVAVVLLAGYALLFEENEWLKKTVVKAAALMVLFSFMVVVIELIPDAIDFINDIASVFGGGFHIAFISNLVNVVVDAIDIIEKILFIGLGVKALGQGSIAIPIVDGLVNRYME